MDDKIGLVLSGGGMRGVAHVGVIQVLEEQGLNISHIAGASAGAIVGALYAEGHSPKEMLEFFRSTSIFKLSNYAFNKPGVIDTDNFISVFKEYFKSDTFESLEKQLFIVATDIENAKSQVFHSGPLIRTILASSAFPMIFSPVTIDDVLYADGGIMNNFPIEPLEDICDKIIDIYVNPINPLKKTDLKTTLSIMERAYHLSIGASSLKKFKAFDILIAPEELSQYETFNVNHIDDIYKIGYEAAKKRLPDIEKLLN
jgi:NTE family protein